MSRNKARKGKIRSLAASTGKRPRGAANIINREHAAHQDAPHQRVPGELTPLTFTCLSCRRQRDVPVRDFASGTIVCPNHERPVTFAIPNNSRYFRVAREIDELRNRHAEVTIGLVAGETEPYLILYRHPRVEVAHVDTFETKLVVTGHWNGPGNPLSFDSPIGGNVGAAVLLWLQKSVKRAA